MEKSVKRRNAARISLKETLEYTPYGVLLPRLEKVSLRGTCVDVGEDASGLGFVTSHPLFTGRKLQVVTRGAARTAEVRWVGAVSEGYRVGVSFRDGSPLRG